MIALLWARRSETRTSNKFRLRSSAPVMNSSDEFQLLSSMRYDESRPWESLLSAPVDESVDADSPILLLSYHRDRVANACDAFGLTGAATKLRENNSCELILSSAQGAIEKERARDKKHTDDGRAYKVKALASFPLLICPNYLQTFIESACRVL